jgi:hypothetical protein
VPFLHRNPRFSDPRESELLVQTTPVLLLASAIGVHSAAGLKDDYVLALVGPSPASRAWCCQRADEPCKG